MAPEKGPKVENHGIARKRKKVVGDSSDGLPPLTEPDMSNTADCQQKVIDLNIPLSDDPFKYELARISRELEEREKIHNEETSQLKAEMEGKIAQVGCEYVSKLREAETKFHAKKKEVDTCKSYIVMNKRLADAFKTKCTDSNTPVVPAKPRGSQLSHG